MRLLILYFLLLSTLCSQAQTANDFVFNLDLDANFQFSMIITGIGDVNIEWGDGQTSLITDPLNSSISNSYINSGVYTIIITGDLKSFTFQNNQNTNIEITQWGTSQWNTMREAFLDCEDLSITATIPPDLSQVTDMSSMFQGVVNLTPDLSNWDVSNVTNMSKMFNLESAQTISSRIFNSDLSSWDVSNVTNMSEMFKSAKEFNSDLSNWDVSNVTDMAYMFADAEQFNSDLSTWDVINVTDMSFMFNRVMNFNSNISSWDVSSVTNMGGMFNSATLFNSDLSAWDVSNVTNMGIMFKGAGNFNSDISNWDVSSVTNMDGMFNSATLFNSDLSSWDVSNVTSMIFMFGGASNFNSDISNWDVSNVTDMYGMFGGASNFNSDISNWDVSNVFNMSQMFVGAEQFNSDISFWDVSRNTDMSEMFFFATSFNQDLSSWNFNPTTNFYFNDTFNFCGMDANNYDMLLTRLASSNFSTFILGASDLEYCDTFSRDILIQRGWFISGDSQSQDCPDNNLSGTINFDLDDNGCDASDLLVSNTAVEINNGTNSLFVYSNNGVYATNLPDGTYTVSPIMNTSLFNFSPVTPSVTLSNATTVSQDFCLTVVAPIDDLEVSILPLEEARPGFDTNYKLIYKNNGNTQLSGNLSLTYEDDFMDFLAATPATSSSSVGILNWDFVDLNPFETREIEFSMNLNTPTDSTFPLNSNDLLNFDATISPTTSDNTPLDNVFDLQQIVVNSYDPNDKTCLQGNVIAPEIVGEYVHYRIRFENEGTASAVNVRIVDYIDLAKFDITTLTPLSSSHDYTAKITEGNKVEFIFDNIQLPFTAPDSEGYVLFKIKTLDTLVLGDDFSNQAEIYFDFNFPIITNLETTAVDVTASINENDALQVNLFPNPANHTVTLASVIMFEEYTIYNTLGAAIISNKLTAPELTQIIDVTNLDSGIYFITVKSSTQFVTKKLVKN